LYTTTLRVNENELQLMWNTLMSNGAKDTRYSTQLMQWLHVK